MKNFLLAERKRNLIPFGFMPVGWDTSWIEDNASGGGGGGGGGTSTPVTVAFSATPAFAATAGSPQTITLTGDVSSSTLTGGTEGARVILRIVQDAPGNHAFVFPTNIRLDPGFSVFPTGNNATILDLVYVNAKWESVAPPVVVPLP